MQISHRYKFVFFSFPKTGSESVRELLDPFADIHGIPFWKTTQAHPFYSHISPQEVRQLFEERQWRYDDYFRFTFVRNPWARLVSLYNMIYHTRAQPSLTEKLKKRFFCRPPAFADWLQQIDAGGKGAGGAKDQRWQVYGAYSIKNYILAENGEKLVDKVIKLEDIDTELPDVLKTIGIPEAESLTVPYVNKRTSRSYAEYYDARSRARIEELYRYDIETFGYRFEDL